MAAKRANAFHCELVRNHDLACAIGEPGFPFHAFEMLQNWQRCRLERTYADFLARDRDAPACRFFLDELYGGMNFRERDQEVARVEPLMARMLPGKALNALADAFRLQAISLEFDMEMAVLLHRRDAETLTTEVYAEVYRECGRRPAREKQILLIRGLGHNLRRLVRTPLLVKMLGLMRRPAQAAGFGRLQAFLEHGLRSFQNLSDPATFVESIYQREWQIMERLFSGEQTPFEFQNVQLK